MAFASIPRNGSIFDNKTVDCLNTQIDALDKTIDSYYVEDLPYQRRLVEAPSKHYDIVVNDASFCIEKMYCMRLSILVAKDYKDEWVKVATLPVDVPLDFYSSIISDKGYYYYFKKVDKDILMSGGSVKVTGDTPDDKIVLNFDFSLPENKLLK